MPNCLNNPTFSPKGLQLIDMYRNMAEHGYETRSGRKIDAAYNDFELVKFRHIVKTQFDKSKIKTVLDYGCGGSDWDEMPIFDGVSAREHFKLKQVKRYEPARNLDERCMSDAVVCFDVLEHIFVSDVPAVLRDILSHAKKLAVINVACYEASALLPNGENAHVTVRHPFWWKGMLDALCPEFPHVTTFLICSTAYNKAETFPIFSDKKRQSDQKFVVGY